MINVIIADDEAWIRKGIKKMIDWTKLGLVLVGEASNGQEAFDLAIKLAPHILITDVRMPEMDGLSLSEKLLKHLPYIKIVIVSGYEDFTYAKRAINFDAISYILKPIDKLELNHVLGKAISRIYDDIESNKLRNSIPTIAEKLLTDSIIYGRREDAEKLAEWLGIEKDMGRKYWISLLQYDKSKYEGFVVKNVIEKAVSDICGKDFRLITFLIEEGKLGLIIISLSDQNDIGFILRRLSLAIKKDNILDFYIGVGDAVDELGDITRSYSQAVDIIKKRRINNEVEILLYNRKIEYNESIYPLQLQKMLSTNIVLNQKDKIDETISNIEKFFTNTPELTVNDSKVFFLAVVTDIVKILLKKENFRKDIIQEGFDYCCKINEQISFSSMKGWLSNYCKKSIDYLNLSRESNMTQIIQDVIEFIKEHFNENINLNMISTKHHVNSSYFSNMFKEKTGENYMDYLTRVRIEKAKEYLTDSKVKVGLVSQMVGFEDGRYFSKLFKRYTGKTPTEFRSDIVKDKSDNLHHR